MKEPKVKMTVTAEKITGSQNEGDRGKTAEAAGASMQPHDMEERRQDFQDDAARIMHEGTAAEAATDAPKAEQQEAEVVVDETARYGRRLMSRWDTHMAEAWRKSSKVDQAALLNHIGASAILHD